MKMPQLDEACLWDLMAAGSSSARFMSDATETIAIAAFAQDSLSAPAETFRGRSVLISSDRQLPAVRTLLQLDGLARRILLCPPDLSPADLPAIMAEAEVDAVVSDGTGPAMRSPGMTARFTLDTTLPRPASSQSNRVVQTEWVLFTSGTTGRPKLVAHTLASLTGSLRDGPVGDMVWSTFYDVRRYGGLQILLRALLGGGSLVLSQADEPVGDFLRRAGRLGVTHILGTPTHWRRVLMSPAAGALSPRYVRLSGEVADQAILNRLARAYPNARLTHAFASTEAGVGFEVNDGLAGFPEALVGQPHARVDLRIMDGSLQIRSARAASRYLGVGALANADGFVDTNDMVELQDGRYRFVGRREGVINVGGLKVHPEEVEAVINQQPGVHMARVRGRSSPITGALVVADIVASPASLLSFEALSADILEACRAALPAHKVPAMLRQVTQLEVSGAGKLARSRA